MESWNNRIDQVTKHYTDTFGSLDQEQLNWKPNAKSWSIAQVIDHVMGVNAAYFPVMASVVDGTHQPPPLGRIGLVVAGFERLILKAVSPDRKWKSKTLPMWEPESSTIAPDILERFRTHQEELKRMIEQSQDLAAKGVIISSPASRLFVLRLSTSYEVLVAHEQRHFAQGQEVLHQLQAATND